MSLLFESPLIAGFDHCDDFISVEEEKTLIGELSRAELAPFRFHGWLGNRKTKTFGWRYDFDDASFAPVGPIPEWLHPLRAKAAGLAGIAPGDFAHVLLARYDPGAGIGWHRDRPQFEDIVGISLGSAATMRLRQRTSHGFRRATAHLEPRSAYLLSGEARWDWEHRITPGDELRFSITFRTLSETGRRIAALA
jgi:alkylated DNA repair dioxygenase AlkB